MIKALENLSDRITVNYEGEPCYDIVFSKDFSEIGNELKKFNIENKKLCIVTESNVGPLYAEKLKNALEPLCKKIIIHEFRAGEENKHVGTVEDIYETLIVNKFDRNDMLLALGGGVLILFRFQLLCYLRLIQVLVEKQALILKLTRIWLELFICQNLYI